MSSGLTEYKFWMEMGNSKTRLKEKIRAIDAATAAKQWCFAHQIEMPEKGLQMMSMLDEA